MAPPAPLRAPTGLSDAACRDIELYHLHQVEWEGEGGGLSAGL